MYFNFYSYYDYDVYMAMIFPELPVVRTWDNYGHKPSTNNMWNTYRHDRPAMRTCPQLYPTGFL